MPAMREKEKNIIEAAQGSVRRSRCKGYFENDTTINRAVSRDAAWFPWLATLFDLSTRNSL